MYLTPGTQRLDDCSFVVNFESGSKHEPLTLLFFFKIVLAWQFHVDFRISLSISGKNKMKTVGVLMLIVLKVKVICGLLPKSAGL